MYNYWQRYASTFRRGLARKACGCWLRPGAATHDMRLLGLARNRLKIKVCDSWRSKINSVRRHEQAKEQFPIAVLVVDDVSASPVPLATEKAVA